MKSNVVRYLPQSVVSAKVVRMCGNTETEIDVDEFVCLLQSKGVVAAEGVVFSALEEMAARIERIRLHWQDDDFEYIARISRSLERIAHGAGLLSVACSAAAVSGALASQDAVAVSATIDRLDRTFDATVSEIWQVFDEI